MAADTGTPLIPLLDDVTERGDGFECQRCGYVAGYDPDILRHRTGWFSECVERRLRSWFSSE